MLEENDEEENCVCEDEDEGALSRKMHKLSSFGNAVKSFSSLQKSNIEHSVGQKMLTSPINDYQHSQFRPGTTKKTLRG